MINRLAFNSAPRLKKALTLGCLSLVMFGGSVRLSFAQTSPAPNELVILEESLPGPTSELVSSDDASLQAQSPSDAQLKPLREKYKTELSIYRSDERAYQLAKEQYAKLGTLASLETAVRATQKVMNSRILVLQTHLQMIRVVLEVTSGIDVQEKAQAISRIDAVLARTRQHQEVLKLAVDRVQLAAAVADYSKISESITSAAYVSLSYVAYGRVQSVYDKTVTIKEEVRQNLEEREASGLALGEKRRAMEEIDRKFKETERKMTAARSYFAPARGKDQLGSNQSSYNQYVSSLGQIYADLLRTIGYLREVIKS